MRLLLLVPGTGSFVCGSCLRDNVLARALRALGHEVELAPLYLPFHLEEGDSNAPVHLGGINVYLQGKSALARRLPDAVAHLLDAPPLLRWASRRVGMTSPEDLGATTFATLRGEDGEIAREIGRLVRWARGLPRPDAVLLSNAMLSSLARPLREATGAPVVCTLQGEMPFLDGLPDPWRARAWTELRTRVGDVAAFVPVSRSYGAAMTARLGVSPERVHPVWNGIELDDFEALERDETGPPAIGFLARLCADKGLPLLVDAWLRLRARVPGVRLLAAGVSLPEDRPLLERQRARIEAEGAAPDASFSENVTRSEKLALLSRASVLSVPAGYGESFGLYLLEAWAAGVPVVQPRSDAFPELLEATGGGVLCTPDDPAALAEAIGDLLLDEPRRHALGEAGRAAVRARFTAARMAADVADVCARVAG